MEVIYGLFFNATNSKSLSDKKEAIRLMQTPILYTNTNISLSDFNLLLSKDLSCISDNFPNSTDYDDFFSAVTQIFSSNQFVSNSLYKSYGIKNLTITPLNENYQFLENLDNNLEYSNYISFIYQNYKFVIANSIEGFRKIYIVPNEYYIIYDEDQKVENNEMLPMLLNIVDNVGKNNIYTSVRKWDYIDETKVKSFYIFYSGEYPSDYVTMELIRSFLVNKYGYENAKLEFPRLFITTERRIFCMYENKQYPINYENLKAFIEENNIISPEIIHVVNFISPCIVEYGLSDIITDYSPNENTNVLNNRFIFYLSSILNSFNGKVLDSNFITSSHYIEYIDDHCVSFECGGVKWFVIKADYTNSHYKLNN